MQSTSLKTAAPTFQEQRGQLDRSGQRCHSHRRQKASKDKKRAREGQHLWSAMGEETEDGAYHKPGQRFDTPGFNNDLQVYGQRTQVCESASREDIELSAWMLGNT